MGVAQVLEVASWLLLGAGSVVVVAAGYLILRMPTFYTRIHAASVNETLGPALILGGLACRAGSWEVLVKLGMVLAFLLLTSPLSSHALAKAAIRNGLEPGAYRRMRERDSRGGAPSSR